jgi:thiol:disulfide interchange protein DsbD
MIRLVIPLLCTLLLASPVRAAVDEADLLPVEQAFALQTAVDAAGTLTLRFDIADGYYLYRHRLGLEAVTERVEAGELSLPAGTKYTDEFFGDVETYRDELVGSAPIRWPDGLATADIEVRFQGCADVGVCYPPHKQVVSVALPERGALANAPATPGEIDGGSGSIGTLPPSGVLAMADAPPNDSAPASNPLAQLLGGTTDPAPMQDDVPAEREPPLPADQAFVFEAIAFSPTQVLARFTMPKGYYLYRDNAAFAVLPADGDKDMSFGAPEWPTATPHVDDHFGEVAVFFDQVEVPITVLPPQEGEQTPFTLRANFQGCQLDGICYPPMERMVDIDLPPADAEQVASAKDAVAARPYIAAPMLLREPEPDDGIAADAGAAIGLDTATGTTRTSTTAAIESETDRLTGALAGGGALMLGGFFVAGLLLAFTPCVLPMVPILSGLIAGAGTISTRRAFVLSLVYVLSTAVIFTAAGVIAGLAGQNLQALFQKPWILISFATLFVVLSFSMFGFYELQLPARWQTRLAQVSNRQSGGSLTGVAVMGVLSALIVGPCVAPPLAAAVTYIGQTGDPVLGGSALFALAMGMGVPLLVVGTGAGRWLPRAGGWMDTVKAVFGVAFLFLAWWMLERILPPAWTLGLLGALLIGCGIFLGAMQRLPENGSGWRKLWQALGVILLVLGAAQLVGALSGAHDYLRPLAHVGGGAGAVTVEKQAAFRNVGSESELDAALATAAAEGKLVLFDFYADWCVECKRMERYTFPEAPVQRALADVVMLKVDVTAQTPDDVALQQRFGIIGPPATLFFRGLEEARSLRLVGYEKPDAFAARIDAAKTAD